MNHTNYSRDADDDDVFHVPTTTVVAKKDSSNPFHDVDQKNKLLNELKQKNKKYAHDPTQIPVGQTTVAPVADTTTVSAETVIAGLFATNK